MATACGICLEDIESLKDRWTHPGGEQHPFHPECIKTWVRVNPTCPCDRQPIDPNSVLTRTERAYDLLKEVGRHALLAGGLYAVSAGIGTVMAGLPGIAVMSVATGVRICASAAVEAAKERAEEADEAADNAQADSEAAASIARECGTAEAYAIAAEAEERAQAFASLADAAENGVKKQMDAAKFGARITNIGILGTGLLSGSMAVSLGAYPMKEVGAALVEWAQDSTEDRRIAGSACALGGIAAVCLTGSYLEISTAAAFAFGALVSAAGAVFSSSRAPR